MVMVDIDLGHYWLKDYPVPNYHCIWNTFVFHTFLFVNNDQWMSMLIIWFHRFMIIHITACPASITHSLSTCSLTGNICFTEGHCLYSVQCTAVYSAVVASCTTLLLWLLCNSSLDREYEAPGHLCADHLWLMANIQYTVHITLYSPSQNLFPLYFPT